VLNPGLDGEWNTDADGVTQECNTGEGISGDLIFILSAKLLETSWQASYLSVAVDGVCHRSISNTAKSETKQSAADGYDAP
jgi:hypothetical protein